MQWNAVRPILPALLVLGLAAPVALQAQVYKWVDENGVITFSNVAKCRSVRWDKVPLNTRSYIDEIQMAARYNDVEESLIRAIIHAESAYRSDAESPKGAQGLMQLMPLTAQELQVANPFDPAANIDGGTRYLSALLDEFDGDFELAAAAYNAGPGAVRRYGGIPPYDETREYVRRVKILYRRYDQVL
jgi:soluble lytic murein transglycosylase-like protein